MDPAKFLHIGGVAERFKATVLKTVVVKATVGSNPTPSAKLLAKLLPAALLCRIES